MDTRFLETFVSVAEHGSLAEAARRLNLTSAAVAQRIAPWKMKSASGCCFVPAET